MSLNLSEYGPSFVSQALLPFTACCEGHRRAHGYSKAQSGYEAKSIKLILRTHTDDRSHLSVKNPETTHLQAL